MVNMRDGDGRSQHGKIVNGVLTLLSFFNDPWYLQKTVFHKRSNIGTEKIDVKVARKCFTEGFSDLELGDIMYDRTKWIDEKDEKLF